MNSKLTKNYQYILNNLKEKIRQARLHAAISANKHLLSVYWEIGDAIAQQENQEGWGAKIVETLSQDLKMEFPDLKGLSPRNLRYMRDFALAYPYLKNLQTPSANLQLPVAKSQKSSFRKPILQLPVAKLESDQLIQHLVLQIPWAHNVVLLDRVKNIKNRIFYIQKTIENSWSREVLIMQIDSKLHNRQGNAITNFENTLPRPQSDLARETLKNPYLFDFLSFGEQVQELELEKALILHIKKFLLELGRGFAYVGNQYNVNVSGDDYFLDLLFYNYHLHCFVVFELKVGEFKPEFAGKLNFYINTIDEQIKGKEDKPTIGVLLCKTPNKTVVKYALQGIKAPIGVANYKLAQALPKQLKGEMPTIQELERELENEAEKLQKPIQKKFNRLKELISGLKHEEVKEKRSPENTKRIFTNMLLPLKKQFTTALTDISKMFEHTEMMIWTDNQGHHTDKAAKDYLKKNEHCAEFKIEIRFRGFKKAGIKAFDCWKDIYISMNQYKYSVAASRGDNKVLLEKLYHQLPTKQELNLVVENYCETILDDITQQVERIKSEKK